IQIGSDLRWLWFRRGGVDGGGGRDAGEERRRSDGSGFVAAASMAVEAGTLEKGEGGRGLGAMRRGYHLLDL
ncbi:hypothetical protein U1Q18_030833, partial [Sarracenia purpurea var. burkii]